MIKIAICDDEEMYREQLEILICEYCMSRNIDYEIRKYKSAEKFQQEDAHQDILFLDIEMEGMDGIELKNSLQRNDSIKIVFVTSHTEGMGEAFGKNVYGFVHKPIEKEKIIKYLDRMMEDFCDDEVIMLPVAYKEMPFKVKEILYISADKRYSQIHTIREEVFCTYGLKELEEMLEEKLFCRCHKGYLVNLLNVSDMKEEIHLTNGEKVPIGRSKKEVVKKAYMDCLIRKAR